MVVRNGVRPSTVCFMVGIPEHRQRVSVRNMGSEVNTASTAAKGALEQATGIDREFFRAISCGAQLPSNRCFG